MLVQAGLCRTCSETTLLVFPRGGSFNGENLRSFVSETIPSGLSIEYADKIENILPKAICFVELGWFKFMT